LTRGFRPFCTTTFRQEMIFLAGSELNKKRGGKKREKKKKKKKILSEEGGGGGGGKDTFKIFTK